MRSCLRAMVLAAVGALALCPCGRVAGQAATASTLPAAEQQRRLWAYRAARAETALRLLEKLRQMPAGEGRVAGLLDQSPSTGRALALHFLSQPEVEPPRYLEDGSCLTTLSEPPADLAEVLEGLRLRHDQARRFKPGDFKALAQQPAIMVSAVGKAPPGLAENVPTPYRTGVDYFALLDAQTRRFWMQYLTPADTARVEQAARDDALSRLAERIKDIRVQPDLRLEDYLAGISGGAKVDWRQFLRGCRERWVLYYRDAPVVEAEVETPLPTVLALVKSHVQLQPRHAAGDIYNLEKLIVAAGEETIRQAGLARANADQLIQPTEAVLASAVLASPPPWMGLTLRAAGGATGGEPGRGVDGKARAPAIRAAAWQAKCLLAERLVGLPIDARTTLGELLQAQPRLRPVLLTVLEDAGPVGEPTFNAADGSAQVVMEVSTTPLWRVLFAWQREQKSTRSPATTPTATRMTATSTTAGPAD